MPTAPKDARQTTDETILSFLEDYPDGLRYSELCRLGKLTNPTCSVGLRRLSKEKKVEQDASLKRYKLTEIGLRDLRVKNVISVIKSGYNIAPPLVDRVLRAAIFAGTFAYQKPQTRKWRPPIALGFVVAERTRKLLWKSWLYYLIKQMQSRGFVKEKVVPQDLIRNWDEVFPEPQRIVVAEYIDSDAFRDWLVTPGAASVLNEVLANFPKNILEG